MKYGIRRFKSKVGIWRSRGVNKRTLIIFSILLFSILAIGPFLLALMVRSSYAGRLVDKIEDLELQKAAVVFMEGQESLDEDRLLSAVKLFEQEKTSKVIVVLKSGETLDVETGLLPDNLQVVNDGEDIVSACTYIKESLQIRSDVVIVSQSQSLARQLYVCNSLGIRATGYVSQSETPEDWWAEIDLMVRAMAKIVLGV